MQHDNTIKIGNSILQHGPANDRVYLMKLDESEMVMVMQTIDELTQENGYSKIFAKVSADAEPFFKSQGFMSEAAVPILVRGKSPCCFMARYHDPDRAVIKNQKSLDEVLTVTKSKIAEVESFPDTSSVKRLNPAHITQLTELYGEVFESYPFPITDPEFILKEMNSDVIFYGIFSGGRLTAAASSEIDYSWKCVEMTDFATLPEMRGQGAAGKLLARMDKDMAAKGIITAFTIARAESHAMNRVFAKDQYCFAGTLRNNTQIGGKLESMNVWYKTISPR